MSTSSSSASKARKLVGGKAADLVQDGMLVGLGTGRTAAHMIDALIERQKKGLRFTAVATSDASAERARKGGIKVLDMDRDNVTSVDLTIDGADEIDPSKAMVKGGGGALLREKLIATASKEMVVIVDDKKLVKQLGAFGLPVEIVPFAHSATIARINALGFRGKLRMDGKSPYVTNNQNYIYDLAFDSGKLGDPVKVHDKLISQVGVVETGLFLGLAGRVIIGKADGTSDVWESGQYAGFT